ncbi:Helicase, C-terminal:Type III restriction enzyme, res subunit:DEAD/DEAH box helicase, N-terminal (plasmid) [Euzebya pacifica]|uniref:Helicase, C-terminal:Type III restriction enzyme, res subunit:DEAD/DEAH box helicase, N-terminal n=1 Tax=Euzebya pacifica TaxID=1608957 RepID=A0A346Y5W7_9ACTN|nr:hypothetical protein [Euzebya pacifica]AXV09864.1 Helicase, C-terminal:Type III restriction enzyme, res subunit:DEAD/DEAH box helicase, N-terminal [Euzebya pacifica]
MDEGGIGVLSRLQEEWDEDVNRALEVLLMDPATGATEPHACDTSCYECLCSFYNQFHHDHLDRTVAGEWVPATHGSIFTARAVTSDWVAVHAGPDGKPTCDSATEKSMVEAIMAKGIPVPMHARHP